MTARNTWLISYDITDDKRRHRVFTTLKGFGDRIQYSVWRCDLSRRARVELEALLSEHIHFRDDQILFIDLGPVGGRGDQCIDALGRRYEPPSRTPHIF